MRTYASATCSVFGGQANMHKSELETLIKARGREFFEIISDEAPSIFNKGWWSGKLMDWCMRNENFKVQLFRFVDVLPYLTSGESLSRHIEEYFAKQEQDIPAALKWGAKGAGLGGRITGPMLGKTIRTNIESMAKQFIIGENIESALKVLTKLRKNNFPFTVDILGEATLSKEEAEQYQRGYLELLQGLQRKEKRWKSLGEAESNLDWGHTSKLYISIKPSSLYSQATPADFDGSVKAICERFAPILRKSKVIGAFVRIDMEQYKYKNMTLEVFRRLRSSPEFRDYPHLGIVLQSYLRDTDQDLDDLLRWAKDKGLPFSIRLVKGAYWDYETVTAKQNGWEMPVYTIKAETDAAFERQPFGGFKMSGVGSKAGGPDYLLQFMDPRVVTENTVRRGFAPVSDEDDWI
jgi:RHH-type transcriptional regulator, proline utilization regulon repressor / proline dehydrogenase / delta 1-pyrroline-5-carboxylate dehydrogenase